MWYNDFSKRALGLFPVSVAIHLEEAQTLFIIPYREILGNYNY